MGKIMIVVPNEEVLCEQLAAEIEKCAQRALANVNSVFRVGLSGGSLIKFLCKALPSIVKTTDLSKWRFYFCDERYVDEQSSDSTFGEYKRALLPSLPGLLPEQFQTINMQLPLDACASDYEQSLRKDFGLPASGGEPPAFDLLLLGMGPDGHTCSLFPGHALLTEHGRWIAPIDNSPKPPPKRITMTLPLINAAKCCMLPISGAGKADMVKCVFEQKEDLPIGQVAPSNGDFVIILDKAAHNGIAATEFTKREIKSD